MNNNYTIVKGDTLAFGVYIYGLNQDLDAAYLTVRPTIDGEIAQQITLGGGIERVPNAEDGAVVYRVRMSPAQTDTLSPGTYVYDMQIEVNGDVETILYGQLEVLQGVTR